MGECGCGSFSPCALMDGPNGLTYVVEVYPSCRDCETGASVRLHIMTAEDLAEWAIADLPKIEFYGDAKVAWLPVLHPADLREKMEAFAKKQKPGTYDYDGLVYDAVNATFRDAVVATLERERQRRVKPKRKRT